MSDRITQPVERHPHQIIENIYTGLDGQPDHASRDDYDVYMVSRKVKQPELLERYVPGSEGVVNEWERRGWFIPPKITALSLAACLAVNVALNAKAIGDRVDELGHSIAKLFEPSKQKAAPSPESNQPQPVTRGSVSLRVSLPGQEQPSGKAAAAPLTVHELAHKIEALEASPRERVDKVTITGTASDEWLAKQERSLGVPDPENAALSAKRANVVRRGLAKILNKDGFKHVKVATGSREDILPTDALGTLLKDSNRDGFSSISEAIRAYNAHKGMPAELKSLVRRIIGSRRTVKAEIDYSEKLAPAPKPAVPKPKPHAAKHSKKDNDAPFGPIIPFLVPPIPLWRRRKYSIFEEGTLERKVPDKVWVELYEPAMERNGDLVDDAWFHSRKYQALMREERIKQVVSYDFQDEEGGNQNFSVLFVDHEPVPETVAAVSELMKEIALMREGKLAERLDAIAIYPTEHTGQRDPKKVGLGIDDEYDTNVQGVAIPALGLVEMHMPKNPTPEKLDHFNGVRWVLAHEIAGHFSDVKSQPVKLRRVVGNQEHLRNFVTSDPWLNVGALQYHGSPRRYVVSLEQRQFAVTDRRPADAARTDEYLVAATDKSLAEAEWARIRGLSPTRYGDTDAGELYAESIAQAITGIPIPFEEAGVPTRNRGFKAPGYAIDASHLFSFAQHVGSVQNRDGFEWRPEQRARLDSTWKVTQTSVDELKRLHGLSEDAKSTPYQPDDKRLRILANATE